MTDLSADRDPLDRLAEEFVARYRRGERPSLTEYAARLSSNCGAGAGATRPSRRSSPPFCSPPS